MPKKKNMVDVLRQAIIDSEMTTYQIAKKAGLLPNHLYRWANGKRGITFETAAKIADVLGLELVKRKQAAH